MRATGLTLAFLGALAAPPAHAQSTSTTWAELRTEPSAVDIAGRATTWWVSRLQVDYREPATFGLLVAAEIHRRGADTNGLVVAGGYRRFGGWTALVQVGAGVDPVFVPRFSLHGQLSRRIAGGLHAQIGYRYLQYPSTLVTIWSPGAIYYHPKGEVEVRADVGRDRSFQRDIATVSARALWDDGSTTLSYTVGGAYGRGLFDVLAIPGTGETGWSVTAGLRLRFDPLNSVRLDLSEGREEPSFRQHSVALSYRRVF